MSKNPARDCKAASNRRPVHSAARAGRRWRWVALSLLGVALTAGPAASHNGAVALATPVEGITVDGDLSDWPRGLTEYPIALTEYGSWPADSADLQASFRVGCDRRAQLLYLAVDVRDESAVLDSPAGRAWNTEDGIEIYLSLDHRGGVAGVQHLLQGSDRVGPDADDGHGVRGRAWHGPGRHAYEWRLPFDQATSPVLSLDLAVLDADRDGSFSWLAWGVGISKHASAARRGDVVVLDRVPTGAVRARVVRADDGNGLGHADVHLASLADSSIELTLQTDRQGMAAAAIPAGRYRLEPAAGGRPAALEVLPAQTTDVTLTAMGATGEKHLAGPGQVVAAGYGMRTGPWQVFGAADGLLRGGIASLAQDSAGCLWIGTAEGVSRFDSERFAHFGPEDGFPGGFVNAVLPTAKGLWIATEGSGLYFYDGTHCTRYSTADGLPEDRVLSLAEDGDGTVWLGTRRGLCRFDGRYFTNFGGDDGISSSDVFLVRFDAGRRLWVATNAGLRYREDGQFRNVELPARESGRIFGLGFDAEGAVWFGTPGVLHRIRGAEHTRFALQTGELLRALLPGRDGTLWAANTRTVNQYLATVRLLNIDRQGLHELPTEALPREVTNTMAADREGGIWLGSQGHLIRYEPSTRVLTVADGLPSNETTALLEDRRGGIWVGTRDGLARSTGDRVAPVGMGDDGSHHPQVLDLAEDDRGRLWVGTTEGLYAGDGARFALWSEPGGPAAGEAVAVVRAEGASIWAGTNRGLWRLGDGAARHFGTEDGLVNNVVHSLASDGAGRLWVGTYNGLDQRQGNRFAALGFAAGAQPPSVTSLLWHAGSLWIAPQLGMVGGLFRYDGTTAVRLTAKDGLSNNHVTSLGAGQHDRVWIGTGSGLTLYERGLLQVQTSQDGLPGTLITDVLEDRQGRVWVATLEGILRRPLTAATPTILIDDVITDRRHGPVDRIDLTTSQSLLAFEVRGISLKTRPGGVRYRYRLAGREEWQTTSGRRVEYSNLPAGDYQFEVLAVDRDLGISRQPARVAVRVHYPYGDLALWSSLFAAVLGLVWQATQLVRRNHRLAVANDDLAVARAAADQANRAKSAFLANMSHEIRTPMNGIVGMVDLLKRTPLEKHQRNYLSIVDNSADALLDLVNDILDLSKVEAGSMQLEQVDFVLWDVLEGVMRLMAARAHGKGLELACYVAPGVPEGLKGDPTRLRQVLVNLIGNAIKFTVEGEIAVSIENTAPTSSVTGPAGDQLELHVAVRDTGVGIAPDKQELVFEAFAQADNSTTRQFGGTGLGLSISRQLVALMGGRIWVESRLGVGSTFHFTAQFGPSTVQAGQAAAPWRQFGPVRVLAADHSATNRHILAEMLAGWGLQVEVAASGPEVLAILARSRAAGARFDLVLLEAAMPDMDGVELARQVQADPGWSGQVLMMLSSLDAQEHIDRLAAVGVRHHVRKPITQSDLLDGIVTALGQELAPSLPEPGPAADGSTPLRILLADDNPTNQYVTTSMLQAAGHTVVVAQSGGEALACWQQDWFDLVLMDVQMPGMDGYQATAAIRQEEQARGRHTPIVGLTANAMRGDREACLAAGMDEYVPKPVRWETLRQAIEGLQIRPAPVGDGNHDAAPAPARHTDAGEPGQVRATRGAMGPTPLAEECAPGTDTAEAEEVNAALSAMGLALLTDEAAGRDANVDPQLLARLEEEAGEGPHDAVLDERALMELSAMEARGAISVAKMVALFEEGTDRALPLLRTWLAEGKSTDLRREAHTLKGNARSMGAHRLAALCQQLENLAREENLGQAEELIARIEPAAAEARAAILAYVSR